VFEDAPTLTYALSGSDATAGRFAATSVTTHSIAVAACATCPGAVLNIATAAASGTASFNALALTADGTTAYFADAGANGVGQLDVATGVLTRVAGPTQGFSGSDVLPDSVTHRDAFGTSARFNGPSGVVLIESTGTLIVADTDNHCLRSVAVYTGLTFTVAGFPADAGLTDGVGTLARFDEPAGLALSPDGTVVFIADAGNNAVRKMTVATSEVSTLVAAGAGLIRPGNVAAAPGGRWLYVAAVNIEVDTQVPSTRLVQVDVSNGAVSPIAAVSGVIADQTRGLAVNAEGTLLFLSDTLHGRLLVATVGAAAAAAGSESPRAFFIAGLPTLLAGGQLNTVPRADAGNAIGVNASLAAPGGLAALPGGRGVLVADGVHRRVRRAVVRPAILIPPTWGAVKYGTISPQLNLRLSIAPTTKLTVTPTGFDLVFDPATVTFGNGVSAAAVTVKGRNAGTKPVVFTFGGADADSYASFDPVDATNAVVVQQADVIIGTVPNLEVFETSTTVTVTLATAPRTRLEVTLSCGAAADVDPPFIVFIPTNYSSAATFTVTALAVGTHAVTAVLAGADAPNFAATSSVFTVTPCSDCPGSVRTLAGVSHADGDQYVNGEVDVATFSQPVAAAADATAVYVTELNGAIRKVGPPYTRLLFFSFTSDSL